MTKKKGGGGGGGGERNSPSPKNKTHLFSYKTFKNPSQRYSISYQSFTTYFTYINLVKPILEILRLISALFFTSTKNKVLLLDSSPNENSDISFAQHKTTDNTTTFLVFTKDSHFK